MDTMDGYAFNAAARWSRGNDLSPGYRALLVATLVHLGIEDADDVLER
jgi:hypothetical protein